MRSHPGLRLGLSLVFVFPIFAAAAFMFGCEEHHHHPEVVEERRSVVVEDVPPPVTVDEYYVVSGRYYYWHPEYHRYIEVRHAPEGRHIVRADRLPERHEEHEEHEEHREYHRPY